ncbi:MAG: hypothetical protein PHG19_04135 [Anaerotignum sp.]|nr:hypothetical protein [Anaerotignum sp.]
MKINIEIESTPEELAVLLCEIKAESETKIPPVGNMGKSVIDVFKEAEFYRKQKKCGRSNF